MLNMNISSIPCKILSSSIPSRLILGATFPCFTVVRAKGREKDRERRYEVKVRPSRCLFWLSLVAYRI